MDPYVPDRIEPSSSASTLGKALLPPHCSARKQGRRSCSGRRLGSSSQHHAHAGVAVSRVTRTPHAAIAFGLVFIHRWRGGRGLSSLFSAFSEERTNVPDATSHGSVTWLEIPKISSRAFKCNYVTSNYDGCSISRDLQL
jgi:hypothetical protein